MTFAPWCPVASAVISSCGAIVGGVVSRTRTVNVVGVASFPCASRAPHVTVVLPSAKRVPLAGAHVAVPFPSTASRVAGASYVTFAPSALSASARTSSCGSMTGAVASCTSTSKVDVAAFPCASVALHHTVEWPKGKTDPLAGASEGVADPQERP